MKIILFLSIAALFFGFLAILEELLFEKQGIIQKIISKRKKCEWILIDLSNEDLRYLSSISQFKIEHIDSHIIKNQALLNLDHRNEHLGRQLDCASVSIRFQKYQDNITYSEKFRVVVTKHYGSPKWDSCKMSYDYPMQFAEYFFAKEAFESKWKEIVDFCYKIETASCHSQRVKLGKISYWTDEKYGTMI